MAKKRKNIEYHTILSIYNKNSTAPLFNGMFECSFTQDQIRKIILDNYIAVKLISERLTGGYA
ncbi:MAG: hypothetical protein WBM43_07400 [Flavobacteriaceae bacterium]